MPASRKAAMVCGSRATLPPIAMAGLPCDCANRAMPLGTLPYGVWLSMAPSPVMTTSAHAHASRACNKSSTSSMPGRMLALNSPSMPPPVPPAAPDPGWLAMLRPLRASMALASLLRPESSSATCCASAPFCGANTAAAPFGPVSGLVTSHARMMGTLHTSSGTSVPSIRASRCSAPPPSGNSRSRSSRKRYPSARARPLPPSVVALPPKPSTIRIAPASIAAWINSPVP